MCKIKIYYAHPMTTYNSRIEREDILLLTSLGFDVLNPNDPIHEKGCNQYALEHGKSRVMEYFTNLIEDECNAVAFRALHDGRMLSGVSAEVQFADEVLGIPVIELPRQLNKRYMTYPETKDYLLETGFYK